jgi:acetyl esterase/lipase
MKNNILLLFILTFFYSLIFAQKPAETLRIWENTSLQKVKSKIYVFYPEKEKNNKTALTICPGGSYCYLGMKQEGYDVAKRLTAQGFTTFVLRYRVGKKASHPDMIQDLQRTIQIIRENAKKYQIEEEKAGIIGFSAGGHLAGTAATYFEENFMENLDIYPQVSLKPYFTVMVYPVVTMRDSFTHKKSRKSLLGKNPTELLMSKLSLEENVHQNMPPLLILHAKDDKVVSDQNSVMLSDNLTNAGIDHKFILYNTGGHGFGANPKIKTDFSVWFNDFMNWYNERIK